MTLLFNVNNQTLSTAPGQTFKVVADSKNYLKDQITFQTQEWRKCNILYALFTYKGKTYKMMLGI